jgi:hypothetical protein
VEEQRSLGAGSSLCEPLRRHPTEREAGVDEPFAEPPGRRHPALHDGVEPRLPRVVEALVQRLEGQPFVQVRHVHGVTRPPHLVGEGLHALGQSLRVVVQHNLGHGSPLSAIQPVIHHGTKPATTHGAATKNTELPSAALSISKPHLHPHHWEGGSSTIGHSLPLANDSLGT